MTHSALPPTSGAGVGHLAVSPTVRNRQTVPFRIAIRRQTLVRLAIGLTFLLTYPLRHLSYAPGLVLTSAAAPGPVPRLVVPLAEIVFPCVLIMSIGRLRLPRGRLWIVLPIVGLLAVFLLSALVNLGQRPDDLQAWALALFAAFRFHFRWVGPFLAGWLLLRRSDVGWLLKLCLLLAVVQTPLAVVQWTMARGRPYAGDLVTGLMGLNGSGFLMLFQVVTVGFLVCLLVRRRIRASWLVPLSLLLVVPVALGDSLFGFLLFPAAILLSLASDRLVPSARTVQLLLLLGLMTSVLAVLYTQAFGRSPLQRFRWDQIVALTTGRVLVQESDRLQAGRLRIVGMVHDSLADSPWSLAFGRGPGSGSLSSIAGPGAFVAAQRYDIEGVMMAAGLVLLELGYGGMLAWLVFGITILVALTRTLLRMSARHDPARAVVAGIRMMVLVLGFATLYNLSLLGTELVFPAWLLIGWGCASNADPVRHG